MTRSGTGAVETEPFYLNGGRYRISWTARKQAKESLCALQALGEVGQAVSSSLDLQEVLITIVSHATRLGGADGGTIYELDEVAGELVHRSSYPGDHGITFESLPERAATGG